MENIVTEKRCCFCGKIKPLSCFYKSKTSKSGVRWQCKQCDKERSAKWYEVNFLRSIGYALAWKKKNPEKNRESALRYQKKNIEKVLPRIKKWFEEHPEARKAAKFNRRTKERNAGGRISGDERKKIFEMANYKCQKCGSVKDLSLDHILPISLGGATAVDNLQVLCMKCNLEKGKKVIDYR